ncbi:MAG: GerMN domain-containing protein [bacterium]|nr:GerMN domain-containing protein [Candidatus Kapabacteria bacterium]
MVTVLRRLLLSIAFVSLIACNADVKVQVPADDSTGIVNDDEPSTGSDTVVTGGGIGNHDSAGGDGDGGGNDGGNGNPHRDSTPTSEINMRVSSPRAGDLITTSRFTLRGECRTFESTGNYRLRNAAGATLAQGHFTATGEMGKFSPYSTTVEIKQAYTGNAMLEVFESSAKDGSEIHKVRVPLRMRVGAPSASKTVSAFFTNSRKDPGASDCGRVFPVSRTVAPTSAVARAALDALLRGPTDDERQKDFASEIPSGTRLRDIVINSGTARADFSRELNTAAGSCRVTAIRSQIEQTLRQFPTVQRVEIAVEGNTSGVLQP